jgi:DNA-binding transcriptional LysR family regulator
VGEPREGLQFGGTEAIKQAAVAGLGFACLSIATVRDLIALKKLVRVETTLPRLARPLFLVHHRSKRFSPTLERFVAHCR